MRIAAVRDLEPIHVRVLNAILVGQKRREAREPELVFAKPGRLPGVAESHLIATRNRQRSGFSEPAFRHAIAGLVRSGLVHSEQEVEVTIEIEIDTEYQTAEGDPSATSETMYWTTEVGREILKELAGVIGPSRVDDSQARDAL